jgi:V8-like Glu-specific endopeptidase
MLAFLPCARLRAVLLASALTVVASAAHAARLPDLSAYACSAAAQETRHIGQVIRGTYHEWYESYAGTGTAQRLTCISIVQPRAQQLSADEARSFLTAAFAVGIPTATAPENDPAALKRALAEAEDVERIPVEPLKGIRERTAESAETRSGSDTAQPPLPASKIFTDVSEAPRGAMKFAPAERSAAPATAGVDDRQPVTSTTEYPWNTLAYFTATYPSGGSFRCSATLVSPYVAVTAGHCVHNANRGGYINSGRIYPGQRQDTLGDGGATRPYGSKSDIAAVQTTAQWTQMSGADSYPVTDYRYDYAAVQFQTPFTHTSTFMPVLYGNTTVPVTSAGYPGTVQGRSAFGLWRNDGAETNRSMSYRNNHVREFAVDASGGNSGGAFFYTDAVTDQRYLVGSLSYGDELSDRSGGPWYDGWNQGLIASWIAWVPGKETIASSTSGLRVASVFSSTQPEMMSYLRFYNAGSTAGTVDVTLADYETGALLATWRSPSLPAGSARQFSITEVEADASVPFAKPLVYSLSVRPTFTGSFQNILWRKFDMTLTNLSTCDAQQRTPTVLTNVHSSLMDGGYPSGIVIHNTSANTINPRFGIFHAQTGQRLGTYATTVAPNSQRIVSIGNLEVAAGISAAGVYHYNIKADTSFSGYLQHLLNNKNARLITDMTETCALSP